MRYLRSLSFIQGTLVNALRTSILFLMLYLIYAQQITVGQFFSLFIYSFFIFGPLQELGNVINIYRETEVSLRNFQDILETPREPKPANPVRGGRAPRRWASTTCASPTRPPPRRPCPTSPSTSRAARPWPSWGRRDRARPRW